MGAGGDKKVPCCQGNLASGEGVGIEKAGVAQLDVNAFGPQRVG